MTATDDGVHGVDWLVGVAARAPSPYNTQPWLFQVAGDEIQLLLDPSRVLPMADPDGREARLACGAALFNMVVSLRAVGRDTVVRVLPDTRRPELLAMLRTRGRRARTPRDQALAAAISRRRTNRRPFVDRPVPTAVVNQLRLAARQEHAQLLSLDGVRYGSFANLVRRADHVQTTDRGFTEELRTWTRDRPGQADGVPPDADGPPRQHESLLALRRHHPDHGQPARPYEHQPLILVVATSHDSQYHQILAGQAMQHVLLTATSLGLSTSFLTQPFEVPATRTKLNRLFATDGHPHTALRVGYGPPTLPTPRRTPAAVTHSAAPSRKTA